MTSPVGDRQLQGAPAREAPSTLSEARFSPTLGWTDLPDTVSPLGSMISGQNVWIRNARLTPRDRLAILGSNNLLSDAAAGAFEYVSSNGTVFPMIASASTIAYLDGSAWTHLRYQTSPTNDAPSGAATDDFRGVSVYLKRHDANVVIMTNGVDRLFEWQGIDDPTGDASGSDRTNNFSTLSGTPPIAQDIVLFDNRPVVWNTTDVSTGTKFAQRLQWPVKGDPEDWTGIGSGVEDIIDMMGEGTRLFAEDGRMIAASTKQIWELAESDAPFIFRKRPLSTKVGIPFARASVQTPAGIFFLNNDYMVYRLQGGQLEPIGKQIQRELRTNLKDFTTAFMGWHATAQQVTLYYTETSGNSPERGFTFNTENSTWTPQAFGNAVTAGFEARVANSLVETLVASDGTALSYSTSAISDGWVSAGELVRSEAVFGGFYTDSPNREVFNDEIRLTYTANSGSSLTVEVSLDGGATYGFEERQDLFTSSTATQKRIHPKLSGLYGTMRLRSEDSGTWEIYDIYTRARVQGEGF